MADNTKQSSTKQNIEISQLKAAAQAKQRAVKEAKQKKKTKIAVTRTKTK